MKRHAVLSLVLREIFGGVRKIFRPKKAETFRKKRGNAGEDFAAKFLRKKGMKILLRNWRHGNDEIDIVALDGECLVFAEVKTRSERDIHGAYAAVDDKKRTVQNRAIHAYLRELKHAPKEWRFDIVAVTVRESDGQMSAEHYHHISLRRS